MYDFYLKTTAEIEGGNLDLMPQVSIFRLTVQFWNFEQNEFNWQEAVTKLTLFQYFWTVLLHKNKILTYQ